MQDKAACSRVHNVRSLKSLQRFRENREWAFAAGTVIIMLLLQSHWDASLIWQDGGGNVSAMSSAVDTGDMLRRILGMLLGFTGLIWLRKSDQRVRAWHPIFLILVAWIGWLSVTVLCSDEFLLSAKRLSLLLMGLISAAAFARLPIVKIFACIAYGVLANLFVGIIAEAFCGTFRPWQPGYRFAGLTHPNLQGAMFAIGIFAALGLAVVSRRRRRIATAIAAVFLCALFLTNSRTSIIAFLVSVTLGGILFLIRRAASRGRLAHVLIVLVCAITFSITVFASFDSVSSVLGKGVKAERDDGGPEQLTGRIDLWKTCLKYTSDHYFVGYGYDSFWSARRISEISKELSWSINQAHSVYIDMLLSGGVPAVLLFILLMAGMLVANIRRFGNGNDACGFWAMVTLFALVHCLTESIILPMTYPSYVLFVGIFWSGLRVHNAVSSSRTTISLEENIHV